MSSNIEHILRFKSNNPYPCRADIVARMLIRLENILYLHLLSVLVTQSVLLKQQWERICKVEVLNSCKWVAQTTHNHFLLINYIIVCHYRHYICVSSLWICQDITSFNSSMPRILSVVNRGSFPRHIPAPRDQSIPRASGLECIQTFEVLTSTLSS